MDLSILYDGSVKNNFAIKNNNEYNSPDPYKSYLLNKVNIPKIMRKLDVKSQIIISGQKTWLKYNQLENEVNTISFNFFKRFVDIFINILIFQYIISTVNS